MTTRIVGQWRPVMSDPPTPIQQEQAAEQDRYVAAVRAALEDPAARECVARWLTSRCTECDADTRDMGGDLTEHITIHGVPRYTNGVVVIGCEGYPLIDPAAVGITDGTGWEDWTVPVFDTDELVHAVRAHAAEHRDEDTGWAEIDEWPDSKIVDSLIDDAGNSPATPADAIAAFTQTAFALAEADAIRRTR